MFEKLQYEDESLLLKLDTKNPIATFDWKYKKRMVKKVKEDDSDEEPDEERAIADAEIQQRIDSYKRTDRLKLRPEYELTVLNVREIFEDSLSCYKCGKKSTSENWKLDRKNNELGHSPENVILACKNCNVCKSDNEQQIFFWDIETPYVENVNEMYSVGITPDKGFFIDTQEFYNSLKQNTIVYYDKDMPNVMKKFEDWLLARIEERRSVVNRKLDYIIKKYIENHRKAKSEEIAKVQDKIRKILIRKNKIIMYAFNCKKFDSHFIWKSKRLRFHNIMENNGIIYLSMDDGLLEFRDVAK